MLFFKFFEPFIFDCCVTLPLYFWDKFEANLRVRNRFRAYMLPANTTFVFFMRKRYKCEPCRHDRMIGNQDGLTPPDLMKCSQSNCLETQPQSPVLTVEL
jgi:hypothetical protein